MSFNVEKIEDLSSSFAPVRGDLHLADAVENGVLILTHGAGGNCNAPLLVKLAETLSQNGISVLRCDLPFRQKRPHGPPLRSASEDQQGLRRAAELMKQRFSGRVFLGGHSYGGRMASMLAAEDPAIAAALVLLSYPLHPPKKPEQMRTAHFPQLRTPTLFVHGSKDEFATAAELERARKPIPAKTEVIELASAGHSLSTKEADVERIAETFQKFIAA